MSVQIIPRESEEQWLSARRLYVTATDIASLVRGGPATWARIRREKLTGERSFFGNKYTEWGHEREPYIIGLLELFYGVRANDGLYVSGCWAATPDAVGEGINGEAKTTLHDWPSVDDIPGKYIDQMQWAMLVTEADRCAFGWEVHEGFQPVKQGHLVIDRDDARIAELVATAERFLTYLDGEEEASEWDDLIGEYAEAEALLAEAQTRMEDIKARIRERAGDSDVKAQGTAGAISYTLPKPRATFDAAAFKKADPATYAEYMKTTPPRQRTLRVTIKKDDDDR